MTTGNGSSTKPITREDLRAGFAGLQGEVTEQAQSARDTIILVAGGAVAVIVILAFVMGRKKGKQDKTFIEIRRV